MTEIWVLICSYNHANAGTEPTFEIKHKFCSPVIKLHIVLQGGVCDPAL